MDKLFRVMAVIFLVAITEIYQINLLAFKLPSQSMNPKGFLLSISRERYSVCENIASPATKPVVKSETMWSEFAKLATETGAINLGQGFPNWEPPQFVIDIAVEALKGKNHQYTGSSGHPRLLSLLAQRYSNHLQTELNPNKHICVTIGASQALYLAVQTLVKPGDEVVAFDPCFNLYVDQVKIAQGVTKFVPLKWSEGEWKFDLETFSRTVNEKTTLVIINSPHNPTGKVFTRKELTDISEIIQKYPKIRVINDEVYKYTIFKDFKIQPNVIDAGMSYMDEDLLKWHVNFATLPGMWERTLTVSSAGKTFGLTGWSVGWIVGSENLIQPIQKRLPSMQFCAPTPLQYAISRVIEQAELPFCGFPSFYHWLRNKFASKQMLLSTGMERGGILPLPGDGGIFLLGDISQLSIDTNLADCESPYQSKTTKDWAFCRWLAQFAGVVALPGSAFYHGSNDACNFVRFAFCKTDEMLHSAAERLQFLEPFRKNIK